MGDEVVVLEAGKLAQAAGWSLAGPPRCLPVAGVWVWRKWHYDVITFEVTQALRCREGDSSW